MVSTEVDNIFLIKRKQYNTWFIYVVSRKIIDAISKHNTVLITNVL